LSSSALNQLLETLKVNANVFHNGQYCGMWSIDTSGENLMNFHVVTRGQCLFKVNEQRYTLSEGDAVFMPSDAKHLIASSFDSDVNQAQSLPMTQGLDDESTGLVCGHFTHRHPVFNRLLAQLPNVIVVRKRDSSAASSILDLLLNESKASEQSTGFLLNRLADALFYILIRDHINDECGILAAMSHPKLSKPLALIHEKLDQKLNVEQLASSAAMSRSAFASLFKKVMTLTPAEYITQWRMTQAYRWLADEGLSTYDAALRCGYESEASFAKAFKRIIGIGPGEARQINKKREIYEKH